MDKLASYHAKNDFRSFWKNTNRLQCRPSLPVSVGGKTEPEEIANLFKDHFIVKSPLGTSESVLDTETIVKKKTQITVKEIVLTIKSMSRGKSPGHDGLSIEHLKYAGLPHLPRVLFMLYNFCLSHSHLPDKMLQTLVVPIVKNKTADLSDTKNYRPISLATVVSKVFDSVLNTQLNRYVKIHDNQFGFRRGLSTEMAVLCVKHSVSYYTKRSTPVVACFLDLSKAFDLVSYDLLWQKLEKSQLPTKLLNIFK